MDHERAVAGDGWTPRGTEAMGAYTALGPALPFRDHIDTSLGIGVVTRMD